MGLKSAFVCLSVIQVITIICLAQNPCRTPNNEDGTCIAVKTCQSAVERLRRRTAADTEYVVRSQCGRDTKGPKVCCELPKRIENPDTTPDDLSLHRNLGRINQAKCGTVNLDKLSFGEVTQIYEFPWMALISYRKGQTRAFKCAGTLINERYVITAAHCVVGLEPGTTLAGIRLGEQNIATPMDCQEHKTGPGGTPIRECAPPVQDVGIESVTVHNDYVHGDYSTPDIALIRLKKNADFSRRNILPICLPAGELGHSSTVPSGVVAGWGQTEDGDSSDVLLKIQMSFVDSTECARTYSDINSNHLCVVGKGGQDACPGDSGGPLMTLEAVGPSISYVQYGVVSTGTLLCGAFNRPVVFTSILSHMKWILDNIT